MIPSERSEQQSFNTVIGDEVIAKITRAVVVSNRDPLFSGRVKVWIPALHGFYSKNQDGDGVVNEPPLPKGVYDPSDCGLGEWDQSEFDISKLARDANGDIAIPSHLVVRNSLLPWAKCLGNNWGPVYDPKSNLMTCGIFNIPKVGTEVFVAFEGNDPNQPIVMGSVIHADEFAYKKNRPLELFPSQDATTLASNSSNAIDESDYTKNASTVFNIVASNGSSLFISDSPIDSCILLSGIVKPSDTNTLPADRYQEYCRAYPGFPTTSSAPFARRSVLNTSGIVSNPSASAGILTTTPSGGVSVSTSSGPNLVNSIPTASNKTWPVAPEPGKTIPRLSGSNPAGNFGAPRPNYKNSEKKHIGVDVAVGIGTPLVAPIDMYAMAYDDSIGAGHRLFCLATDGTAHGFFHLQSILPSIVNMIRTGKSSLIKTGTQLGYTGNTGTYGANAHLHWEIYRDASSVTTSTQLMNLSNKAHSLGTSACINPIIWMQTAPGANSSCKIELTPEQARHYVETSSVYTRSDSEDSSRPVGLEICTLPGQESIFLRHPSGSYIGIDHDGNIQQYSVGDINIKGNRSLNIDVLGGILQTCYAKFTRVKSVLKTWAGVFARPARDLAATDDTYPEFFKRVEKQRLVDMNDALRASNNTKLVVAPASAADGKIQVSSITDAIKPQAGYDSIASTANKNYGNTTYDAIIKEKYTQYINTPELRSIFPDWKIFKAQMLKESNGDPNAVSGIGAIGLMQITPIAVKDTLGLKANQVVDMTPYKNPERNIDMGIRHTISNYNRYIKSAISKRNNAIGANTVVEPEDVRYLTQLAYIMGGPTVSSEIQRAKTNPEILLTYRDIEAAIRTTSNNQYKNSLSYVPTIDWILGKLA